MERIDGPPPRWVATNGRSGARLATADAIPLPGTPDAPAPPDDAGRVHRVDLVRARAAVSELLDALGIDHRDDEHMADTPRRVAAAWASATSGYGGDPDRHLRVTFPAPPDAGLVIVSPIRLVSTCAHHLLPITGYATVAYRPAPGGRIVGLSKLARTVNVYSRRMQVQERIGYQVATALARTLDATGAACVITAEHGCMSTRGVEEPEALTTTYALAGSWAMDTPDVAAVMARHEGAAGR